MQVSHGYHLFMRREAYRVRERIKVIRNNYSLNKLDSVLQENYGHNFSDFCSSFLFVMRNLAWKREETKKRDIFLHKKELQTLERTLKGFFDYLLKTSTYDCLRKNIKPNRIVLENRLNTLLVRNKHYSQILRDLVRRTVVLEKNILLAKLASIKITNVYKISSVWATVLQKNRRPQWEEIYNLLHWFKDNYEKEFGKELSQAKGMEDPVMLKKAYHNLKRKYIEEISRIKFICFEWQGRKNLLETIIRYPDRSFPF